MNKISRKGFLKIAAAAAMSGVTAGALAACNAASSSTAASSGAAGSYTPGTYTGTAEGISSTVKVTMTFSDSAEMCIRDRPDGGQWDMAISLIKKYGVVPSWVMPETVHSTGTAKYLPILNRKLREDALELRAMAKEGKDTAARREEDVYKRQVRRGQAHICRWDLCGQGRCTGSRRR